MSTTRHDHDSHLVFRAAGTKHLGLALGEWVSWGASANWEYLSGPGWERFCEDADAARHLALARIEGGLCPQCASPVERHGDWVRCPSWRGATGTCHPVEFQVRPIDRVPTFVYRTVLTIGDTLIPLRSKGE